MDSVFARCLQSHRQQKLMTKPLIQSTDDLPQGYIVRPTTMDDAEAVAKMWEIVSAAKGIPEKQDPEDQRNSWQRPRFNLHESSIIIEDAAHNVVGYAAVLDTADPPVRPWLSWHLLPEHYGSGLAEYLIRWLEQKAQRVLARCPANAKITLQMGSQPDYVRRVQVLNKLGYEHIRSFWRMVIHMDEAPPKAIFPDGISIRPYRHPDELDALINADNEGFRDHWGHVEHPFEQLKAMWIHWLETDKLFDPSLFFLAIDDASGEIAALCLCRNEQEGDPSVAYVDSLAVLRPYRKRGLALALLNHSFGAFWQKGRKSVALHVDTSSLTGATRLYEKAGMHMDQVWADYAKVIRDGIELATTAVE